MSVESERIQHHVLDGQCDPTYHRLRKDALDRLILEVQAEMPCYFMYQGASIGCFLPISGAAENGAWHPCPSCLARMRKAGWTRGPEFERPEGFGEGKMIAKVPA